MHQQGFRSLFVKLFASVMLALILFAVAMVLLTQLVHDKDANTRSEVLATQILNQVDPFLQELNVSIGNENRLQSRFMLAVIKKSFDIFDDSLQAKMGLYDSSGHLLMQTDNSDLSAKLPATPSLLSRVFPYFSEAPQTHQAQVHSSTGYTLLYESRLPPKKPVLSAALNLFTGTLLLLLIMAGVLWWIARSMTWRLNQMSQQMRQLGDGDFTVRVNTRGNDEIALLARGFNQAAQKIEHLINANSLLLAHASHELRTPITRIRLQIEMMDMLAEAMPVDTKIKFDKRANAINRDLSGLNDLVESILLVSRLDAGHAMQQIEPLDLYDLMNQERQHYPESTLIGEHIIIEGQAPMLTHLIRNLLTNAMLHGEPPVTVLLYGIQTLDEADIPPAYLLQSLVSNSLIDYNDLGYSFSENSALEDTKYPSLLHTDNTPPQELTLIQKTDSSPYLSDPNHATIADNTDDIPAPIIYRNGETLAISNHDNPNNNHNYPNDNDLIYLQSEDNDLKTGTRVDVTMATSLVNNYHKFTTELTDKIKKTVWNAVPETQAPTQNNAQKNSKKHSKVLKKEDAKTNHKNDGKDTSDTSPTSRKESLFKKHLKKTKAEPVRPLPKYAVLAVIDEGGGIPEDKREEIFSPFVRLQQKKKGSGLGLSLVSQIVNAHQGRISTDTINGHTRFLIVLPVTHDPHYNYHNHDNKHPQDSHH